MSDEKEKSGDEQQVTVPLKTDVHNEPQPPALEPLKEPFEARVYKGPDGEVIHGLFPLSGATPRFQGEAVVRARMAGPMPEMNIPFMFDIRGATTPQEAFANYKDALMRAAPRAKQDAAKAWMRQYGRPEQLAGMQRTGLVDAMGHAIPSRMPKKS